MSIVNNHFPQVKWRDGKKYLWNPIHRKPLKNRPEERVRLQVIEYLMESGWSKHRISTEEGITSTSKNKLRTDLICYTHQFEPFLLAECKAEKIRISERTAEQIGRYNTQVNAPFLLITNGRNDFWYSFKDQKQPILEKAIPEPFRNSVQSQKKPFFYWAERGFAGKKAAPNLRTWLTDQLNCYVQNKDNATWHYLSFKKNLYDLNINHYYHIQSFPEHRVALAFISTVYGGTRLLGIFNKSGENTGVLEINLDLLFDDRTPNTSLYSDQGRQNLNIHDYLDWDTKSFHFTECSKQMNYLFDELIG